LSGSAIQTDVRRTTPQFSGVGQMSFVFQVRFLVVNECFSLRCFPHSHAPPLVSLELLAAVQMRVPAQNW
jgi:hypothetical protein